MEIGGEIKRCIERKRDTERQIDRKTYREKETQR